MADNSIAKAYRQVLPIYTTINATAVVKQVVSAATVANVALNANTSTISLKTSIDDVVYIKFKTAVGDADVSVTNFDDVIESGELAIDRGRFKTETATTTHVSILSATAGDVFVIEK